MKYLSLSLFLFVTVSFAAEKTSLLKNNTSLDLIELPYIKLTKAVMADADHFVNNLAGNIEVSRFMFGAEISQEEVEAKKNSKRVKLLAKIFFASPTWLSKLAFGAGARWTIKDNNDARIGSIGLSALPPVIKDFLKSQGINGDKYENMSVSLEPVAQNKKYAKQAVYALLERIFNSAEYRQIDGIAWCINKNNEHALQCLTNKNTHEFKSPIMYHGEVHIPNGFSTVAPRPCDIKCFTIKRNNFLAIQYTKKNNNNN